MEMPSNLNIKPDLPLHTTYFLMVPTSSSLGDNGKKPSQMHFGTYTSKAVLKILNLPVLWEQEGSLLMKFCYF